MSQTPDCTTLIKALRTVSCDGIKEPGGLEGEIYIGSRADLQSVTFGTNGEITAIAMKSSKYLEKYVGKREKHLVTFATIEQEPRNMFESTGVFAFWPYTAAEYEAIEKLGLAEKKFIIYRTQSNRLKAIGLDVHPNTADIYYNNGLKGTIEGTEGEVFSTPIEKKVTFKGTFFSPPKLFRPATTLATVTSDLEALLSP
jgi:hypothetical protein